MTLRPHQIACQPHAAAHNYTGLDQNFFYWSTRPVLDKDSLISCWTGGAVAIAEEVWETYPRSNSFNIYNLPSMSYNPAALNLVRF